jgi:hypothetical protein
MALPSSRAQFKNYCLRALGAPVVEINVDDDQIEDRIDEALQTFWDYHFDGVEKIFYKYQVTAQTKIDRYVPVPENIIGVINLFPIGQSMNSNNLFNIRYQIALNDLYTLTSVSMVPYYMAFTHIQFLEQMLVGQQPLRYNRHVNKLYIDMDWNIINEGDFIVAEAYQVVDPNTYTDVYKDRWLLKYATCLIKKNWGTNLKKFQNMQMPGGLTFNGQQIYDEAVAEEKELMQELVNSWSLPASDMIGSFMLGLVSIGSLLSFLPQMF